MPNADDGDLEGDGLSRALRGESPAEPRRPIDLRTTLGDNRPRSRRAVAVRQPDGWFTEPWYRNAFAFLALLFFASTPCILFGGARGTLDGKFTQSADSGMLFSVGAAIFFAGAAIGILIGIPRFIRAIALIWPIWAVVLFCGATSAWSINPQLSASKSLVLFGTTLVPVFIGVAIAPGQQLRLLLTALTILMLASLAIAVVAPGMAFDQGEGHMLHGVYAQKNALGWAAAMGGIIALGAFFTSLMWRPLAIGAGLVALAVIVASKSATALIVVAIGAIIYLALYIVRSGGRFWMLVALGLVGFAAPVVFALRQISEVVFGALGKNETLTGRTAIWAALQEPIAMKPVGGWGYMAFWPDPISNYYMRHAFWAGNAQGGYHELVINIGFLGLALFLAAYGYVLVMNARRAIAGDPISMIYAALLGGLLIMGWTAPVFLAVNMMYWMIVTLAAVYVVRANNFLR